MKHLKSFEGMQAMTTSNDAGPIQILKKEDIAADMIAFDCINKINVKIIKVIKIQDLRDDPEMFRKLQNTSESKWLSYEFDMMPANPSGTLEYFEDDPDKPINNLEEFLTKNSFAKLTYDDVLIVVRTTHTINKIIDYDNMHHYKYFYEVLPYLPKFAVVDAKEGWKKSKKLKDINNKTGVFDIGEEDYE